MSRLPIEAGDKVRYLLLSKSPYGESCTAIGNWFPRSFPLRAEYNDYGSVENVEEGIGRDLWRAALSIDLLSVGVGGNSCHDVPTSKTMSWEDLLIAIREKRVFVRQDLGDRQEDRKAFHKLTGAKYMTPKGVPTMQRVRKALLKAGFKTSPGLLSAKAGFMVDKIRYGTVRVRWQRIGAADNTEKLAKAQVCLAEYATVVKAGSGAYADEAELLVFPRPGIDNFRERGLPKKKPLLVDHLMIREDVWQGLLTMPALYGYGSDFFTIDEHRKRTRDFYRRCIEEFHRKVPGVPEDASPEAAKSLTDSITLMQQFRRFQLEMFGSNDPIGQWVSRDEVPFAVGLATNWRLLIEKNFSEEAAGPTLDAIAEMIHVLRVLYPARFQWAPSNSCGPQFGEWELHAAVHRLFATLAAGVAQQQDAENAEVFKEA